MDECRSRNRISPFDSFRASPSTPVSLMPLLPPRPGLSGPRIPDDDLPACEELQHRVAGGRLEEHEVVRERKDRGDPPPPSREEVSQERPGVAQELEREQDAIEARMSR